MRAAANYMMGRYRDAHNDIAGAAFDADRHAAFWRGLIEAALENWDDAHADLDRAEPVLKQYPPEWQARQRIAKAQAALGLGHLEVADAAVARLPQTICRRSCSSKPTRARAACWRPRTAATKPARCSMRSEQSGDERAAAEAIYYRIDAALKAGVMSDDAAIDDARAAALSLARRHAGIEDAAQARVALFRQAALARRTAYAAHRGARASRTTTWRARRRTTCATAFEDLFLKGKADKIRTGGGACDLLRLHRPDADRAGRRRDDPAHVRPPGRRRSARPGGRSAELPDHQAPRRRGARPGRDQAGHDLSDGPEAAGRRWTRSAPRRSAPCPTT